MSTVSLTHAGPVARLTLHLNGRDRRGHRALVERERVVPPDDAHAVAVGLAHPLEGGLDARVLL